MRTTFAYRSFRHNLLSDNVQSGRKILPRGQRPGAFCEEPERSLADTGVFTQPLDFFIFTINAFFSRKPAGEAAVTAWQGHWWRRSENKPWQNKELAAFTCSLGAKRALTGGDNREHRAPGCTPGHGSQGGEHAPVGTVNGGGQRQEGGVPGRDGSVDGADQPANGHWQKVPAGRGDRRETIRQDGKRGGKLVSAPWMQTRIVCFTCVLAARRPGPQSACGPPLSHRCDRRCSGCWRQRRCCRCGRRRSIYPGTGPAC